MLDIMLFIIGRKVTIKACVLWSAKGFDTMML